MSSRPSPVDGGDECARASNASTATGRCRAISINGAIASCASQRIIVEKGDMRTGVIRSRLIMPIMVPKRASGPRRLSMPSIRTAAAPACSAANAITAAISGLSSGLRNGAGRKTIRPPEAAIFYPVVQ
ncbi:hypothetical protein KCP75_17675 [Salmonella enterica subsp. enterica]|nr:hypothetical protein KCP75_17675 [Salmonella enterica subsp. enterica]